MRCRGGARLADQPLEATGVDPVGLDDHCVAPGARDEHVSGGRAAPLLEQPSQPGDLRLDRAGRIVGLAVAPQDVGQPVVRDDRSGLGQQRCQQDALRPAAEPDLVAADVDAQLTQDPEPELRPSRT
ncbi:hypothetical protein U6N30_18360 [Blastococcus brunescens]|uniref:Uncharacterized protein n=1 Tax=Blastococcus brunescens TaxID=1564165 RepID=A0ABZ1B901_9ACTN|nr:hypothetical protein [Blastococcus sp. BMG 8361]WRL67284.1 hypothetical protein U6N30_18360 [Blastococcus sp. BMG 8361]